MSMNYGLKRVFFRISLEDGNKEDIMVGEEEVQKALEDALPGVVVRVTEIDACEICGGMRKGVPGNENVLPDGRIACDYCDAKEER